MAIDYNRVEQEANRVRYFLGFRETIVLCLGLFPPTMTRSSFYQVFSRVHQRLEKVGVIEFDLPPERVFIAMLAKLRRKDIIREIYQQQNYTIKLTEQGEAAFEVIYSNLQAHPDFNRVMNVFEFYRNIIDF